MASSMAVELVAEEDGNDGGGRLVGAETVVVARRGDGDAEQVLIIVNGLDDGAQEEQELRVFVRRVAGLKEVHARVRRRWTSCCACRSR